MGVDLLDIVYRLEKTFSIRIDREDMVPYDILNDTQGKYVANGKLTLLGLEELKARIPSADFSSFETNPIIQSFASILTVGTLCDIVEQKIRKKNEDASGFPNVLLQINTSVSKMLAMCFNIADTEKIKRELRLEQLISLSDTPLPTDFWKRFHKIQRAEPNEWKAIKTYVRSRVLISIWKTSYWALTISLICGVIFWLGSTVLLLEAFWINDILFLLMALFVPAPIPILFGFRFVANWKRCGQASRVTVGEIIDYLVDQRPNRSVRGDGLPYSREEIEQGVAVALCESLGVTPEEIRPEARIYQDLGAQ